MKIAVAKETEPGERRVALTPDVVSRLSKKGLTILVESGAGEGAFFSNEDYESAGASIIDEPAVLWGEADILLKVQPPRILDSGASEVQHLKPASVLICFLNPLANPEGIDAIAQQEVTAFSMELVPRTTRAQSMDALSSQASLAGYKAVLMAAARLPKFFPMLTTAAGTIRPAKVFIMGAGVAGLQAIATARRLGAVVEAFDIRPEVKEQVQSLGAKFVEVALEEETSAGGGYAKELSEESKARSRELVTAHVSNADVVITTAQVPGKKAPLLVTAEMVSQMKPGSVIVDLAANQGGNCAYTESGRTIHHHGITIIGPENAPASIPVHASQMYAKNLQALLALMIQDNELMLNFEDDIIDAACVTHSREIRNQRIREMLAPVSV